MVGNGARHVVLIRSQDEFLGLAVVSNAPGLGRVRHPSFVDLGGWVGLLLGSSLLIFGVLLIFSRTNKVKLLF